jgi:hypothetical protein
LKRPSICFGETSAKIPRTNGVFDRLEECVLPDALATAKNEGVVRLFLWPLDPVRQPADNVGRRAFEYVPEVLEPDSSVDSLTMANDWWSV